jgi:hypothetical protein
MAAKPGPLLALAAAGAFFFMTKKKKEDEPIKIDPKPGTNGQNGGTQPSNGSTPPQTTEPPEEHDHSSYGDGTVDIVEERDFSELDGSNPIEFRPNKEGEAILVTNIPDSWAYSMRSPGSVVETDNEFAAPASSLPGCRP